MIGIFLIYFIGKYFYNLADEFDKNKWVFAILGVVTFYAAQVILGVILAISDLLFSTNLIEGSSDATLSFLGIPVGLLACTGLYFFLKKFWKKNTKMEDNKIEEIGKY